MNGRDDIPAEMSGPGLAPKCINHDVRLKHLERDVEGGLDGINTKMDDMSNKFDTKIDGLRSDFGKELGAVKTEIGGMQNEMGRLAGAMEIVAGIDTRRGRPPSYGNPSTMAHPSRAGNPHNNSRNGSTVEMGRFRVRGNAAKTSAIIIAVGIAIAIVVTVILLNLPS